MVELIKLAKMTGVMHEADYAYSVRNACLLHRLATDVPFMACVINFALYFYPVFVEISVLLDDLDCRILEF